MVKIKKILSLKPEVKFRKWDENDRFLKKEFVEQVVMECLSNNDPKGAIEVIQTYIDILDKEKLKTP